MKYLSMGQGKTGDRHGKDLTGKELGKGFTQRKDGRYQTRISLGGGKKPICLYGHTLKEVKKKRENY